MHRAGHQESFEKELYLMAQKAVRDMHFSEIYHPDTGALYGCLLYTSDAADEEDSVDLGGRRIIKKKKREENKRQGNRK